MTLVTKLKKTTLGLFVLAVPFITGPQAGESPRSKSPRSVIHDNEVSRLEDTISNVLIDFEKQHRLENKMIFDFDRAPWMLLITDVLESSSNTFEKGCVYVIDVTSKESNKQIAYFKKLSITMKQDGIGIFHGHFIQDANWSINLGYHYPLGADSINMVNLKEFQRYYETYPQEKTDVLWNYSRLHPNFGKKPDPTSVSEEKKRVLLQDYHSKNTLVGKRILY